MQSGYGTVTPLYGRAEWFPVSHGSLVPSLTSSAGPLRCYSGRTCWLFIIFINMFCFCVFFFQHRGGIPVSEVYYVNSSYPGRNSNLWRIDFFFFKVFLFEVCFYKDLYNSVMYLLIQNLSCIIIKFEVYNVKSVNIWWVWWYFLYETTINRTVRFKFIMASNLKLIGNKWIGHNHLYSSKLIFIFSMWDVFFINILPHAQTSRSETWTMWE